MGFAPVIDGCRSSIGAGLSYAQYKGLVRETEARETMSVAHTYKIHANVAGRSFPQGSQEFVKRKEVLTKTVGGTHQSE